jgi:translocation protein SEC63
MKVDTPQEETESDIEDDISEPDEDTIAGQMAMMKGQPVRRSGAGGDDEEDDEEEDDDEEDSDEDSDSSDSSSSDSSSDSDSD